MNILTKLQGIKIYPKLIIFFMAFILPLYAVNWYTNSLGSKTMEKEIRDSATARTHFYLEAFKSDMNRILQIMNNYSGDDDIERVATLAPNMSQFERFQAINRIQSKLFALKNSSEYIKSVKLYIPLLDRTIDSGGYYDIRIDQDEIEALTNKSQNGGPFVYWNNRLLFGLVFPGRMVSDQPPSFVLEVELDKYEIERSLYKLNNSSRTAIELIHSNKDWTINTNGNVKMTDMIDKNRIRSFATSIGSTFLSVNGEDYLVTYEGDLDLGVSIYMFVPEQEIFGTFKSYQKLLILLAVLSVLLILMVTFGIHRFIHRPLVKLIQALRKVERGEFDIAILPISQDEFSYLYLQFNSMVTKLKQLIQENYEQKILAQRSELKQLQAQINPHFLYNSFFILYQMVYDDDRNNSLLLIKHLRKYFQFITRNAQDEVTLREEIDHALSYLQIQEMRFEDRIRVIVEDIPNSFHYVKVPRLIIQPLIENAYQHGLEEKIEHGQLNIRFRDEEDSVSVLIEDNGDSLQEDKLADLQLELKSEDKFAETTGLINIQRRLQMFYSGNADLIVSKADNGGFRVELRIPKNGD